jgi:hypothetical protein
LQILKFCGQFSNELSLVNWRQTSILGNSHLSGEQIENVEGKMDKRVVQLDNEGDIKIKSKTKNKPKTEKQTNQTKNKGKKEGQQR